MTCRRNSSAAGSRRRSAGQVSQSDLDDLRAILDRYPDEKAADIRRILARRAA